MKLVKSLTAMALLYTAPAFADLNTVCSGNMPMVQGMPQGQKTIVIQYDGVGAPSIVVDGQNVGAEFVADLNAPLDSRVFLFSYRDSNNDRMSISYNQILRKAVLQSDMELKYKINLLCD